MQQDPPKKNCCSVQVWSRWSGGTNYIVPCLTGLFVHVTPYLSYHLVRAGLRNSCGRAEAGVWLVEVGGAVIAPQRRCESVIKNIENHMATLHKHDAAQCPGCNVPVLHLRDDMGNDDDDSDYNHDDGDDDEDADADGDVDNDDDDDDDDNDAEYLSDFDHDVDVDDDDDDHDDEDDDEEEDEDEVGYDEDDEDDYDDDDDGGGAGSW